MDPLDLFRPNTNIQRIYLDPPTSRKHVPTSMDALDRELKSLQIDKVYERTEYVEEYVKAEEQRTLQGATSDNHDKPNNMEDISVGTLPIMQEIQAEELTKIYTTYNFAFRKNDKLTISKMQEKIVSMVQSNPVVIIQGPTGCGKTTQVPQYLLDESYNKRMPCNIIVTQPRRIAAISIANRVSAERSWPLGTLVGYQVGMDNKTSRDTRLTYCTTGVLLRKLIRAKNMLEYTHVILDEVHERSQEMDFLLLVVRKLLRTNSRQTKVILMSATIDVDKFSMYFQSPAKGVLVDAPIVDIVKDSQFPVHTYYLDVMGAVGPIPEVSFEEPRISMDMMHFCVQLIIILDSPDKEAHENRLKRERNEDDDVEENDVDDDDPESFKRPVVLVFLPGIFEIEELYDLLRLPKHHGMKWDIVVMHSSITSEDQQNIFKNPPRGHRRIILSTNIAESSITVPDVKYVIDFCLTKQLVMNPATNFQSLELIWASKANCDQRAGRTGRVTAGRVYRLVRQDFYNNCLPKDSDPEMLRAPLESLVLNSKLLDMGEPKELLALSMDPPDLSNLKRTIKLLKEAGALYNIDDDFSETDGELTNLGRIMAHLPLDIRISKLIALGHLFSILKDAIIMGASMATKSMFSNPFQKKLDAYNAKIMWANKTSSDCIASLNAFKAWMNEKASNRITTASSEKEWARRHFVQVRVLREVSNFAREIEKRLENLGIVESVGEDRVIWNPIMCALIQKVIIAGAFYPNYFIKNAKDYEEDGKQSLKMVSGLDPAKTVYLQGWPVNQPGPLYAKRIQNLFGACSPATIEKIFVSFDNSSRVYIHFWNREQIETKEERAPDEAGKISPAVYRAVKLRQINTPMVVPVLSEYSSTAMAKKLKIISDRSNAIFNTKPTSTKVKKNFGNQPLLPGLDTTMIHLKITEVIDPGHFWANAIDEEAQKKLDTILRYVNVDDNFLVPITSTPRLETLVFAPFSNQDKWYHRGLIESIKTDRGLQIATVFYVDCGKTGKVQVKDLRVLRTFAPSESELAKEFELPAQVFECVLANIRPTFMSSISGEWSPNARKEFGNLLKNDQQQRPKFIYGHVFSVVNSVVALTLFCKKSTNENEKPINVNEHLIEKRFAEQCEVDYLSKTNHELRKNYDNLDAAQRAVYEEQQYDPYTSTAVYHEPPKDQDCNKTVLLRGPFSPLEIELMHVTRAGAAKKVRIDTFSVNSVLLDTTPYDPHNRLLVAGFVGESPSGNNLNIRDTTLMPHISGLTAILTLLFASKIELRRTPSKGNYIGALCGLGIYPRESENDPAIPLFPEHDTEILFDVEIDNDDLFVINKLRHWMNLCLNLEKDQTESMKDTIICQVKIREYLFNLLDKKRPSQKPETVFRFSKWKLYQESDFLMPGRQSASMKTIYPLHYALELVHEDQEKKVMRANQKELLELARTDIRNRRTIDTKCLLCNEAIFGINELRAHLFSKEHYLAMKKHEIE